MRQCKLQKINNTNQCIRCGRTIDSDLPVEKIHIICGDQTNYQPKNVIIVPANKIPELLEKQEELENSKKPKIDMPSKGEMAKNALIALGQFIMNPHSVTTKQYEERLKVCSGCDRYDDESNRCGVCGCFLALKAQGAAFNCPLKKWPGEENFEPIEDTSSEHIQVESPSKSQPHQE